MQSTTTPLIRLAHVSKHFDSFEAVSDVSFDITEGESIGIVGPNGAGKTTLLRMLCALTPVSSGSIEYNGQVVSYSETPEKQGKNAPSNQVGFRRAIGFVPQSTTLDGKLTANENLELQSRLYHINPLEIKGEIMRNLELVGLTEFTARPVENYSGGMKRRLELARALFHHPRILILDEPTLGLDPIAKHEIWDYLHRLQETEKVTLLLTTNTMDEAERLCGHLVIINNGRLVIQGSPQELKQHIPGDPTLDEVFLHFTRPIEGVPFSQVTILRKIMDSLGISPKKEAGRP